MTQSLLRGLLLALSATPTHVFFVAPTSRPLLIISVPCALRTARISLLDEDDPYRKLGIDEDAGYDEINTAFDDLSEIYGGDAARLSALEAAKDQVINNLLAKRMAGAAASYEGSLAAEDRKLEPKTPLWVHANECRKKVTLRPSRQHALHVVGLLGTLTVAPWLAPSLSKLAPLLVSLAGYGFMYNRGESEVPRDDFGQIGEVRPTKRGPALATVGVIAFVWLLAQLRTMAILAPLSAKQVKAMAPIIRTTFAGLGLIVPSLFFRVHGMFD